MKTARLTHLPTYNHPVIPEEIEDQRLVLLIGDEIGRSMRARIVDRLEAADVPFRPAVVGCDRPFPGFEAVADAMTELLQTFRPHVAHVAVGRDDLRRTLEPDGASHPARRLADIRRDLNRIIDAAKQSADTDVVLSTVAAVRDDLQEEIRDDDVDRLNVVIREVGQRRDVLVDRWDQAIDRRPEGPDHLLPDGRGISSRGLDLVASSTTTAIVDALIRAENPWNRLTRIGRGGPLDGIPRPRHPELS